MKTCITCGMPFSGDHANDMGMELPEGTVCKFDSENGQLKSPEAIFAGGVEFFAGVVGGDRDLAARLTRTNMKSLPYWQKHPFAELEGQQATKEEFTAATAKM